MGEDLGAETAALADLADGLDVVHGGALGVGEAEPVALGAGTVGVKLNSDTSTSLALAKALRVWSRIPV